MKKNVDREKELIDKFNGVIKNVLNIEDDIYKDITFEGLIELKKAISSINNIITLKVTQTFVDKLYKDGVISKGQAGRMKKVVNGTSANANGYDVRHDKEAKLDKEIMYENGDINILAEVKCNLPVKGDEFGAKQKKGIEDDINGLLDAGRKTKGGVEYTTGYFKFMVFLDAPGVEKSVKKILEAEYEGKCVYYTNPDGDIQIEKERLNPNVVYIVFISETKS